MKKYYKLVVKLTSRLISPKIKTSPKVKPNIDLTHLEIFKPKLVRLIDKLVISPLSILPVAFLYLYYNIN